MRGIRSSMSNFVHSTPRGISGYIMSDGKRSTHVTGSSTNTLLFKRFMDGFHKRMGDVKRQNAALTIDVLLGLQSLLTERWKEAQGISDEDLLYKIAALGCTVTAGFSLGLRGKEIGHIRLNETILLTTQGLHHKRKPHLVLGLEGHFKGQISRKKHKIPITCVTKSGINNQEWLMQLIERYEKANEAFGPSIRASVTDQSGASIKQLDVMLHKHLLSLQEQEPDLLPENIDVVNAYSIRQLLRRGSTLQARNVEVSREVINLNNRWRSEKAAGNRFGGR
ncbi:hypothetical protein ACA910_006150 [Epithemia clementina (nom. ined.)]